MPPPPSAALPVPRLFGLKEDSRYIEEEEELINSRGGKRERDLLWLLLTPFSGSSQHNVQLSDSQS
ncbi:hypothetical protein TYRP_013803 [Tyrophagus putrescentiae]|nr:hypothetical protein TYRP_013803 [Tyrophagus putrescentiae]